MSTADAQGPLPALQMNSIEAHMAIQQGKLNAPAPNAIGASLDLAAILAGQIELGSVGIPFRNGVRAIDFKSTSCFEVLQVIDNENVLLIGFEREPFWITMPTKGMFDSQQVDLSRKEFAYIGAKQYEAGAGTTKTVIHLEYRGDVSKEELRKIVRRSKSRIWIDKTGKFKTSAQFVEYSRGTVKLLKSESGKEVAVSLAALSVEDQKYVKGLLKQRSRKRD